MANDSAIPACFSVTYGEARDKFLAAAKDAGAELESYDHPLKGPDGEDLAMDVARLGPAEASRRLVISSATHGVEGFCGSGIQIGLLRNNLAGELPDDTSLLIVHAHNPHGFAHQRRVNEDNVDINRNFPDYAEALPENTAYAEVHDMLVPADWDGPAREAADRNIAAFIEDRGLFAYQAAVTLGQYDHADGLFYGGREPTWSNRTIHAMAAKWCAGAEHLGFIDLHTGLGPRGFGELILVAAERTEEADRTRAWYGDDVKSPSAGDSVSAVVQGTLEIGYLAEIGDAKMTPIAVEYGTIPPMDVLQALRADNWLYLHGDVDSELGQSIKRDIRAAFFGEEDQWKNDVYARALEISRKALAGLAAS